MMDTALLCTDSITQKAGLSHRHRRQLPRTSARWMQNILTQVGHSITNVLCIVIIKPSSSHNDLKVH